MPYVEIFRTAEEIAYISEVRVDGDAHVRLADNQWAWCPVADLIRVGLLQAATEPARAPEGGER